MAWHTYLIRTNINTLYCGVTTDLARRLTEHQANGSKTAKYLRGKQPLELVWHYQAQTKQQAMQLEWHIKRLNKAQKEALCLDNSRLTDLLQVAILDNKP